MTTLENLSNTNINHQERKMPQDSPSLSGSDTKRIPDYRLIRKFIDSLTLDQIEELHEICSDYDSWDLFETEIYRTHAALWENPYDHID